MGALYDACTSQYLNGQSGSNVIAHTCGGSNRGLLVFIFTDEDNPVTSVDYNSDAMTQEAAYDIYASFGKWVYVYSLKNPDGGASYNVDITLSGVASCIVSIVSLTGVEQSGDPFGVVAAETHSTDPAPDMDVASAINGIVVDFLSNESSEIVPTAGSGQTKVGDANNVTIGRSATSWESGNDPTVDMAWSLSSSATSWHVGLNVEGIPTLKNQHALL